MASQLIKMSLNKDKLQRGMHGASASAQTQIIRRVKRSEDRLGGELLEGIPNDFMLIEIAARLPWSAWKAAAAVSLDWQRAFQGGMVYNARVVSQKTETFVVVSCNFVKVDYAGYPGWPRMEKRTLSLFSPNEERWYKLPTIPGFPTGIPLNCQHAFFDSSIYLLGVTRSGRPGIPSAEVLVLDLAGHPLEWRRCADMLIPRYKFHIGIMHGKIFVFGGFHDGGIYELSNEAYDPEVDAWSWIAPLIPSVSPDTVYTVEQVYSVGQQFVCRGYMPEKSVGWMDATKILDGMRGDTPNFLGGMRDDTPNLGTRLVFSERASEFGVDDADDQMDGLHKIIESQFIDDVGRLRRSPPWLHLSSDDSLAFAIRHEAQRGVPALWAYDPVEDEWRDFERESLDWNNVEWALPKNSGDLSVDSDESDRTAWPVGMRMWTLSF